MRHQHALSVRDVVDAGMVRRVAADLARQLGFDDPTAGRLAIVVTELATNIAKHAHEGEVLLGVRTHHGVEAVEMLALDRGPGMTSVDRCLGDGYSTAGSPGTGLGAVTRQSTYFDITSTRNLGTAILAGVAPAAPRRGRPASAFDVGSVTVPKPGEDVCGDGYAACEASGAAAAMVVDGLGHGPLASEASEAAMKAFAEAADRTPRVATACSSWRATAC